MFLSDYQYKLIYWSSTKSIFADALSQVPLLINDKTKLSKSNYGKNLSQLNNSLVISKEVEIEGRRNSSIACVIEMVLTGNCDMCEGQEHFKYFVCRKKQIWGWKSLLVAGLRMVLSLKLRERALSQSHNYRPGVSRMKAQSRRYIWSPNVH